MFFKSHKVLQAFFVAGFMFSSPMLASDNGDDNLAIQRTSKAEASDDFVLISQEEKAVTQDISLLEAEPNLELADKAALKTYSAKILGNAVKDFVENRGLGGQIVSYVAGLFSQKVLGTDTITEYLLARNLIQTKFLPEYLKRYVDQHLEDKVPPSKKAQLEGIVGKLIKKLVTATVPAGAQITMVTGVVSKLAFGKDTLTEVVICFIQGKDLTQLKAEATETEEELQTKAGKLLHALGVPVGPLQFVGKKVLGLEYGKNNQTEPVLAQGEQELAVVADAPKTSPEPVTGLGKWLVKKGAPTGLVTGVGSAFITYPNSNNGK
jgi:hypothetical protein